MENGKSEKEIKELEVLASKLASLDEDGRALITKLVTVDDLGREKVRSYMNQIIGEREEEQNVGDELLRDAQE